MSKAARVGLANILAKSGYDPVKILRAIKYPFCASLSLSFIYGELAPSEMNVDIFVQDEKEEQITLSVGGFTVLKDAIPPMLSECRFDYSAVLYFFYEGTDIPQSLFSSHNVTIPPPPEWPEIDFPHT